MSKSSPLLALSMTEALVVVAPFSNAFIKDWSPEHYRQLIELCVERGGVRAVVVGTSGQRELGNQIIRALPAPAVENRCGTMSWLELGALIDGSAAVVGNDLGMLLTSPQRAAPGRFAYLEGRNPSSNGWPEAHASSCCRNEPPALRAQFTIIPPVRIKSAV